MPSENKASIHLHYVFLWSGIVIGVGGQWLLKAGAGAPDLISQLLSPTTLAGLVFYGAATACYLIAIRRIPITVAFPSISLSYIVVLAVAVIAFREALSIGKIAGTALIVGGVWLLNRPARSGAVASAPATAPSSAEFDEGAESYDGGFNNPVKRLLAGSPDDYIAVKARWLMRREPLLATGALQFLDYGCGAGDLMRVLAQAGARAQFVGCDVSTAMLNQVGKRWLEHLGSKPELAVQDGARTDFADRRFDVVVVSSVLHHVAPADRPSVYAELGRLLKAGGRLYVFEHNPLNPLVRYVIAHTPIDASAILLNSREVRGGLLAAGRYELTMEYLMFMPPGIAFLRYVDRLLAWLPLGAQYVVQASKAP